MDRKDYDPMQTTGTSDTGTGTYRRRAGEEPSPGTSSVLKGETETSAQERDGTTYTSVTDELDESVAAADDTGMVAQQQLISEQMEQPPD
jgi:hypothetical protein